MKPFYENCEILRQDALDYLFMGLNVQQTFKTNEVNYTVMLTIIPINVFKELVKKIGELNIDKNIGLLVT